MSLKLTNENLRTENFGTFAVIVTYNPDENIFRTILKNLTEQKTTIIVVDNNSETKFINEIYEEYAKNNYPIHFLKLDRNYGIAAAQNKGIILAKEKNAEYILLLDHDSIPEEGMINVLINEYLNLKKNNISVGAVGALTYDRRTGINSKVLRSSKWTIRKISPSCQDDHVEADFLISSGTLIPISTIDLCGMMNESYFIDMVDTEWCFRVKTHDLRLFVVPKARLQHALGDQVVRIWFGGWRDVCIHSPQRDYYLFRNVIRMLLTTRMSFAWRMAYLTRLPQWLVFFCLFAPQRMRRMRLIAKGIVDGLLKREGPL